MTDRKLMQMELDALRDARLSIQQWNDFRHDSLKKQEELDSDIASLFPAIQALRDRLAQPEPDPVAYYYEQSGHIHWAVPPLSDEEQTMDFRPLYTAPSKHEWVGLTDEEYEQIIKQKTYWYEVAKAVEAKLKEKNT